MTYWLDAAKAAQARDAAEKLAARLTREGADLHGVVLIDKAKADRLAARMAIKRPRAPAEGGGA